MTDPIATDRPEEASDRTSSFGYRTVDTAEKPGLVQAIFDSVADRYDMMNDLMSVGVHRLWKNYLLDLVKPKAEEVLCDVAGGTGDIAVRWHRRGGGPVLVCDLTESMLRVGRDRAIDRGILTGIDWVAADAEALPLADESVDAYTIAFGLRNVARIDRALAEARRVLKPGGRFFCLEFSRMTIPGLRNLYDLYSFAVLPRLGRMVAEDEDAYRYLVESIRRFPDQEALKARIAAAGLGAVRYRNLTGGVAAIHSAWRV